MLSDDYARVPELIAEIDDMAPGDSGRVWLYLALDWLHEHRDEYADPFEVVEMLYADFDYPSEIEGFVRFFARGSDRDGSAGASLARMPPPEIRGVRGSALSAPFLLLLSAGFTRTPTITTPSSPVAVASRTLAAASQPHTLGYQES